MGCHQCKLICNDDGEIDQRPEISRMIWSESIFCIQWYWRGNLTREGRTYSAVDREHLCKIQEI